ncbi:MAG: hypothetical protein RL653_3527 [Pseudomonadota bacterium]|jgi:hypothetical protein
MSTPAVPKPGAALGLPFAGVVVLSAVGRMVFVAALGGGLPYWDQWDAEGAHLLKPWLDGTWEPSALLAPHNEHRVLWTRLAVLGLFEANGRQWDNLPAALFNAGLAGVLWGGLWAAVARGLGTASRVGLAVTVLAMSWLPFGWENSLLGFNTHFFLLMLGALALTWLAAGQEDRPVRGGAALGLVAAVSAFTMASSVVSCVSAAGVVALRVAWGSLRIRTALAWVGVLGAAAWMTWAFVPVVPGHAPLKASSAAEWALAFRRAAAWPAEGPWGLGALMWAPVLLLGARCWRSRRAGDGALRVLGLAAWVLGQAAAMAYARGHGFQEVSSRYTDLLAVGVVANLGAAWRLWEEGARGTWSWLPLAGTSLVAAAGLVRHAPGDLAAARTYGQTGERHAAVVREYLRTGDFQVLAEAGGDLPYPDAERLRQLLDTPSLRGVLPPEGRGGEAGPLGGPARRFARAVRGWFGLGPPGMEGRRRLPAGVSCARAEAVVIPAGGQVEGTLRATPGDELVGLELLVGTYGGRADGAVRATLCAGACATGEAPLAAAVDNAPLAIRLPAPVVVPPGGIVRYAVGQPGSVHHPVALWSCRGEPPGSASTPRLWLWVADRPALP